MIRKRTVSTLATSTLAASALTASALVAAAIALPSAASAQASDAPIVARVSFTDLDLAAAPGVTALQHRVKAAVSIVCPDADIPDLQAYSAMRRCRREAAATAAGQVTAAIGQSQRMAAKDGAEHIASR